MKNNDFDDDDDDDDDDKINYKQWLATDCIILSCI